MPLQDDRGGRFIARCAGGEENDVVVRVLNAAKIVRRGEAYKIITDGFRVAGAMRDGAQLLKIGKHGLRLQMIENGHDKAPLLVK